MSAPTITIVGAGQAGVQLADSLRQEGYDGALLLIGAEPHAPYQRPPLSKKWLIEAGNAASLALRGPEALARRQITLRLDTHVVSIDRTRRELQLTDGERVGYAQLALTTGSRPRTLTIPGAQLEGVLTLRSVTDAMAISAMLRRSMTVDAAKKALIQETLSQSESYLG
jgi:3-phenylpropionate/trans-cinnamate dioxygenase ferredoxin reductase subunit